MAHTITNYIEKDKKLEIISDLLRFQKNEESYIYEGRMLFVLKKQKQKLQCFLDKGKTKVLMHAISNHHFSRLFPNRTFSDERTLVHPNGNIRVILSISLEQEPVHGYQFMISMERNGQKAEETLFLPYLDMLEIAQENIDYIQNIERIQLEKEKPLFTHPIPEKEKIMHYKIPYGPEKNKMISELTNEHLEYILSREKQEDPIVKELHEHAKKELERRKYESQIS